MLTNTQLPTGYSSVDEAIKLIQSDRDDNVVVDMDYIITRKKWIETGHTFRIPRIRRLAPNEIYRNKRGQVVEFAKTGEMNVLITTNLEKELLLKTINDKYRELVGHEYQEAIARGISTVADDAQGQSAVRPRRNTPNTKVGDAIGGSGIATSNGEALSV